MYPALVVSTLGILAAISWGTADFFAAKASRRVSPEATALSVSIIGTVVFAIICVVYPGSSSWKLDGTLYAVAAGSCLELGLFALYRGLDIGPVSLVSPIGSAYPAITTLVVLSIFGASLSQIQGIGIFVTVIGLMLASGFLGLRKLPKKLTAGVTYGIIALVLLGVAYAMLGESVTKIGWQKSAAVDTASGLLALIITLTLISRQNVRGILAAKRFSDRFVLLTALAQIAGGVVFTIGLAHAQSTAVITAISATYPVFAVFLAIRHLGEKARIIPIAGVFITMLGIVLLSS